MSFLRMRIAEGVYFIAWSWMFAVLLIIRDSLVFSVPFIQALPVAIIVGLLSISTVIIGLMIEEQKLHPHVKSLQISVGALVLFIAVWSSFVLN